MALVSKQSLNQTNFTDKVSPVGFHFACGCGSAVTDLTDEVRGQFGQGLVCSKCIPVVGVHGCRKKVSSAWDPELSRVFSFMLGVKSEYSIAHFLRILSS